MRTAPSSGVPRSVEMAKLRRNIWFLRSFYYSDVHDFSGKRFTIALLPERLSRENVDKVGLAHAG